VLRGAGEAGDEASVDIAVQRIHAHEKAAWMLRSQTEECAAGRKRVAPAKTASTGAMTDTIKR
jgi:hypothetical protein